MNAKKLWSRLFSQSRPVSKIDDTQDHLAHQLAKERPLVALHVYILCENRKMFQQEFHWTRVVEVKRITDTPSRMAFKRFAVHATIDRALRKGFFPVRIPEERWERYDPRRAWYPFVWDSAPTIYGTEGTKR